MNASVPITSMYGRYVDSTSISVASPFSISRVENLVKSRDHNLDEMFTAGTVRKIGALLNAIRSRSGSSQRCR